MTGKDAVIDPIVTIQIFADQTWKITATKDADPLLVSAVIANMNNKLRGRKMTGSYPRRSDKDCAAAHMSGLGALFE